ncbi:hypothetical protein N2600_20725 [Rhizobium sp. WSM1274]|uniref:hypothetical protein n=1 Tax=Rhizobium sp. WSM1274 TaxID=3138254 RepID=UPI0021A5F3CB|nr:hypothetical protein [Rhizobium leguminosarum]UWU27749.1 hypothetical protein N2600_20725 [Rhizobium leguminosarum bv. viciae]
MNETEDQKLNRAYREGKDAFLNDSQNGFKSNPYEDTGDGDLEEKMHDEFARGFNEAQRSDQK